MSLPQISNLAKVSILTCLIGLSSFFAIGKAEALTLSPARLELSGDPGATISGDFLVINEQGEEKTFYTSAENFEASGETGTPSFTGAQDGLASWIKLEPQVTLSKGGQEKIHFTVSIPKDAEAGGHFAAIFLNTAPPNAAPGQVAVGAKVGVLILLHVSGEVKEGGGIASFDTSDKKLFYASLPVSFSYRFANSGNDRVGPHGELAVRDMVGLKAAALDPNASQGNVLPGSTRRFDVSWGPETPRPSGFLAAALFEASHFAFGFYRASIKLEYGNGGKSDASTWLVVLPWQLILISLVIIAAVLLVGGNLLRRYNRWIISKARS